MFFRALSLLLLALLATVCVAAPADYERVYFEGKSFPLSPLKKRMARLKSLDVSAQPGDALSAQLYRPDVEQKVPAIIMNHDCRGIQAYQQQWARLLKSWGYAVLLLDSFSTRGIEATCEGLGERENFLIRGGRTQDLFAAYDYLKAQDFVAPFRIGLMGWDYFNTLGALANHGLQQKFDTPFMGAVALYPSCNATIGTGSVSPLLIIAAEKDDWTPADQCHKMIEYSKHNMDKIKVKVMAGAQHGFDDPALVDETFFPHFRNYYKNPALGVTMQYDESAHQQSIKLVRQFLDFNVKYRPIQITLDDLPSEFTPEQIAQAAWINPPDEHGPDIPPEGYSLFDRIFASTEDGVVKHDIPYPFDQLLDKLSKLVDDPGATASNIKVALFPAGRSLTRNASAPDFFKYPRIVVAVDAESRLSDGQYGPLLKDRLYIALTEPANVLEVISYNDVEQRFEFQVVHNYAQNLRPTVSYAKRSLCLSCHQNHAPIFPNAPWDETNFNQQVFSKIKAVRDDFYGFTAAVPALSSTNDIDRSTSRATMLPIYHALWVKSCAAKGAIKADSARRCRAQIFKSMLQYRLSNKTSFDHSEQHYKDDFLLQATAAWQEYWPDGLIIPRSNITDRNPFTEKMVVSSNFDPLVRREPETIWYGHKVRNVEQVIIGLAQQINYHDIERLDALISDVGKDTNEGPKVTHFESDCTLTPGRVSADHSSVTIRCSDRNQVEKNSFALKGALDLNFKANSVKGKINSVRLNESSLIYDLIFDATRFESNANTLSATFKPRHRKSHLSVRTPNGSALLNARLLIDKDAFKRGKAPIKASLQIAVLDQLKGVNDAIDALVLEQTQTANSLFSDAPFSASLYMRELMAKMGANDIITDCCESQAIGLEKKTVSPGAAIIQGDIDLMKAPMTSVFATLCRDCHLTGLEFPPSFLSGNEAQVQANLIQCAPRIAYRLQMWKQAGAERLKSPMPPIAPMVGTQKLSDAQWQNHPVIERITRYALALMDSSVAENTLLSRVLKSPFEALQECRVVHKQQ